MPASSRQFAIVTGASAGIGYHLARECAQAGFDLLVAADRAEIHQAAEDFRGLGVEVDAVECDLAATEGVDARGPVGTSKKDDPADVARVGFKAMMAGEGDVVAGLKNKVQVAVANVTPSAVLAEQHRKMAEPGSATK